MIHELVYLVNARLLSEKGRRYQISKMCEAFGLNSVRVTLFHPYRHQVDPALDGHTVFDYYGIQSIY